MRMQSILLAGWLLVVGAAPACAAAPPAAIDETKYLTADKIRAGMKGHGLTVFQGTAPERFDVEVLGVLHNAWGVDSDIILIRCSGKNLEHTGIAAGMSGSPIYIDDKLIGALAYGFTFAKAPIAGVTPIAEMLPVAERAGRAPAGKGAAVFKLDKPVEVFGREFAELILARRFMAAEGGADPGAGLSPIATPVRLAGLGPRGVASRLLRAFGPELEELGLMPVQGGMAGADDTKDAKIEPGAVVGARLLWGDLNWDAIGTVTDVAGDRVLAFGHPMFGDADVDIPMTTGCVHAFVPSFSRTFKLGSGGRIVGRIDTDRATGIAGTLGPHGESVRISVSVSGPEADKTRTYRFEALRHPSITPAIIGLAASSCLFQTGDPPEELTARYRITVAAAGLEPLVIENIESGWDGMGAVARVYVELRQALAAILQNEFRRVYPESVRVEAAFEPVRRFAMIETAALDRTTVRRGETARLTVELKPVRGERTRKTIDVPIPADAPLGPATVQVCGQAEREAAERKDAPGRFVPQDFGQMLDLLRRRYRRDRLCVRLSYAGGGVALKGKELVDLPASVYGVMASQRQTGMSPVRSTSLVEVPCDVVVSGSQLLKLKIEEEK